MNHAQCRKLALVTVLLTGSVARAEAASSAAASAPCPPDAVRQDEMWLISTRHCGCPSGCEVTACDLDVRRCTAEAQWCESSLNEFLAGESQLTVVYIHGNRVDWWDAQRRGRMAYQSLIGSGNEIPPMRFVIWSWPSDQVRGALRDVRSKADRADGEGSYFAWFLSQLHEETPVRLIGHSYGARIIGGGLHLAARNASQSIPAPRLRVAYLAPAMANGWICIGGCHGQSLKSIERLLILYNSCDPALARFRFSERCAKPVALGYAGIDSSCLGGAADRVEQWNVCCQVGKTHDEAAYWCNGSVVAGIRQALFPTVEATIDPISR